MQHRLVELQLGHQIRIHVPVRQHLRRDRAARLAAEGRIAVERHRKDRRIELALERRLAFEGHGESDRAPGIAKGDRTPRHVPCVGTLLDPFVKVLRLAPLERWGHLRVRDLIEQAHRDRDAEPQQRGLRLWQIVFTNRCAVRRHHRDQLGPEDARSHKDGEQRQDHEQGEDEQDFFHDSNSDSDASKIKRIPGNRRRLFRVAQTGNT